MSCSSASRASSRATTSSSRSISRARRAARSTAARCSRRERTARSLSQQLARTGSLLATELDPVAVLGAVVDEATALLGADAATLAALEGDELVVTAAVGGECRAGARRALAVDGLGRRRRRAVARPRSPSRTLGRREPRGGGRLLAAGHRAFLGVPLIVGPKGPLHGVLSVYAREAAAWREEEIQALGALAANASVALSNAELYQRVAVEREQSVAILANIADGIVAVDRDGHVVLWNAAAEEITGVPASEALGRTPAQVLQRELESESGGTHRLVSIPRAGERGLALACRRR